MRKTPEVALFVDMLGGYGRAVLSGIASYVRTHEPWTFLGDPERAVAPIRDLRSWRGDGIIAQAYTPELRRLLRQSRIPAVNVSARLPRSNVPSVLADDVGVGEAAARYFMERGFTSFGYAGFTGHRYSAIRGEAFAATVRAAGYACSLYESNPVLLARGKWQVEQRAMQRWIESLPRPVAVMGCNDVRARHVAQVCLDLRLRIPEELALLGADNDELICEISNPPLSSIDLHVQRIGYEAAALLDRLMKGAAPADAPLLVPPGQIVTRQSSDVLAIGDADVAAAVRFIRDHAAHPISVDDVVAATTAGRRQLERRFRRMLQRSIGTHIVLAHLDRAKKLLIDTDLNANDVAFRCGYRHVQQFASAFRQHTGMTPARYRRQYRMR